MMMTVPSSLNNSLSEITKKEEIYQSQVTLITQKEHCCYIMRCYILRQKLLHFALMLHFAA